jgi:hypothetical protein
MGVNFILSAASGLGQMPTRRLAIDVSFTRYLAECTRTSEPLRKIGWMAPPDWAGVENVFIR